jgi:asparagine synthetase B (glutamine-hydrolysing)
MCGILVSKNGRGNDRFIKRRGPDATGVLERDCLTFRHYLLNVTGPATPQPFIDGDIVCLYNGEIYNHPFVSSDGENLIPLYRQHGILFPRELDGEFAIALYDFAADLAYFITDRFATKPLWRNGSECASYESGVGGHKIWANTIEVARISDGQDIETIHYHAWDWRQHVTSYDGCIAAFEAAVAKRYKPECFIGLSSGYDSGAIACALRGKELKAYAHLASETASVIGRRDVVLDYQVTIIGSFDIAVQEHHLRDNAEEFFYRIRYDNCIGASSYKDDYAAKALSYICSLANAEGRKVCLSGAGADEILSDYSLLPRQSEFKGKFPDALREWSNFTGSCMYSYLGKEEAVGGSWGIETRYPFLDTAFVQSFLSLAAPLKNRHYKAPLHEYLTRERFPFERDVKRGWSP